MKRHFSFAASLLSAFLVSGPALADEGKLPPALATLGKAHLLILHFPIALLFGLLFTELVLRKKIPVERRKEVTGTLLLIAAVGAVVAAATGLLYAANEDWHGHTETLMAQHRTSGIVTAVIAVATLVAFRTAKLQKAYLPMLAWAAVGVTFTGHGGGNLVHGEGYLLEAFKADSDDGKGKGHKEDGDEPVAVGDGDEPVEEARARWPEGQIVDKPSYAKDIKPLLERSCVKCHGPEKRKSGLRLDKKRFAMKGGETGPAIVPGNLGESLLIKYITLSPDDEDVMPSKGKLLANSEIETLKKWVEQGAEWPDDEAK